MRPGVVLAMGFLMSISSVQASAAEDAASIRTYVEKIGYHSFALKKLPTGHETIEVTINGQSGVFVLDSGAGRTVVHKERLAKFGLNTSNGGQQGTGAGGDIPITSHPVGSFLLDNEAIPLNVVFATNLDSVVNRLQAATGVIVDGVVGQDVLGGYSGIINIGSSELYLKLPASK